MERRPTRWAGTLFVLAGIVLAAVGNLASDLLSAAVPSEAKRAALPALSLVVLAEFVVALLLLRAQRFATEQDPQRRRHARRSATVALIVLAEFLAAALGAVSNVASGDLPPEFSRNAWLPFLVVAALVAVVAVLLHLCQNAPPVAETNRAKFLEQLRTRYDHRREDALGGAALLALGLRDEPEALSGPVLALGRADSVREPADAHALPLGTSIDQVYD
nr:hypothetical protein [Ktedonobacterales bacterium]